MNETVFEYEDDSASVISMDVTGNYIVRHEPPHGPDDYECYICMNFKERVE